MPAIGEEIPEHEHIWDAGCVTLEATCVNEGQITYSCAVCGTLRVEALPMTDHVVETRGYREPGCTYGGYSGDQVCVYCGTLIAKGTETEPAGHSWGEGTPAGDGEEVRSYIPAPSAARSRWRPSP